MVVVVLVEFYFSLKVIGIETFVFDPKNIERQGRRNRECLEYALGHAFKAVKGQNYQVLIQGVFSVEIGVAA